MALPRTTQMRAGGIVRTTTRHSNMGRRCRSDCRHDDLPRTTQMRAGGIFWTILAHVTSRTHKATSIDVRTVFARLRETCG